jgi:exodeoxyribonuclease VII small subunit
MTFEQDITRLEEIAAELDGDGVSLDRALALFEEGVERLRRATAELSRAEARVTQLVEQADGTFVRRPFSE